MSFDIASVGSNPPAKAPAPARTAPAEGAAGSGAATSSDPVKVDTLPAAPPHEVLDAMSKASESYENLANADRHLHFKIDRHTGKLTVEVHDLRGQLLFTVPASKALEVAEGAPL